MEELEMTERWQVHGNTLRRWIRRFILLKMYNKKEYEKRKKFSKTPLKNIYKKI
jgi:hypothetical protein